MSCSLIELFHGKGRLTFFSYHSNFFGNSSSGSKSHKSNNLDNSLDGNHYVNNDDFPPEIIVQVEVNEFNRGQGYGESDNNDAHNKEGRNEVSEYKATFGLGNTG